MKYAYSEEWTLKARQLAEKLGYRHVKPHRLSVLVSSGTKTRRTQARIHGLPKAFQLGMACDAFYVIELIHEQFSRLPESEKDKVLIHELMHIPHNFGGGFRHHNPFVTTAKVEEEFRRAAAQK